MKMEGFAIFTTMEEQNNNQLNIELTEDVAEGVYANLAIITHSSSEFVLDFIRVMPGVPKARVKSRVVLTPEHAKRLLSALEDNIEKYEEAKSQDEKNRLKDSIAEIKVSLNKFFKLKLKLKDNKGIKEYIMDPKVPSNDFRKIIDGYKNISISLDEKGLYPPRSSINNYFY